MIEIAGLNRRQRALCDILWGIESQEQAQAFVSSLPQADQQQCRILMDLMVWACIDEVDTVGDEVVELLNRIRHQS